MYAVSHQGNAFTPEGKANITDVSAHNAEVERKEIEWLKTGPDKVFLYVRTPEPSESFASYEQWRGQCAIQTWLGTVVSTACSIGPRRRMGFWGSYRRHVNASICGHHYHGWYFESSGSYCRLKRCK
jgi:hypothetical protein